MASTLGWFLPFKTAFNGGLSILVENELIFSYSVTFKYQIIGFYEGRKKGKKANL